MVSDNERLYMRDVNKRERKRPILRSQAHGRRLSEDERGCCDKKSSNVRDKEEERKGGRECDK